ncbi:MAG TPA: DUF5666 domain-containing protein [Pyrinomonadaceae bacterium]|nr:DUF5666 domain-containing protein [Pyrinomonadaceae bacterium]
MKILARLLTLSIALVLLAGAASREARVFAQAGADAPSAQNRLVGEVQSANLTAGELTIKTDDGRTVLLKTAERVSVLRIPPGETSTQSATKIALSDVSVGDRVFARGELASDGRSFSARQIVVANKQAVAQTQEAQREDWQRRGVFGRIEAINSERKEITIRTRGREGAQQTVTVDASGKVKFMRNAPDSSRAQDAVASTFADLRVGDQLRARGERSSDGTRVTAEEIVTSNVQRTAGTVQSVNASANEVVIRNEQTGQTQTIVIGQRSMLRRITPELASQMAERRAQAGGAGANGERRRGQGAGGAGTGGGQGNARPAGQGDGQQREGGQRRGGPGGGRGMQEMLQSLPAVTVAELKKGDMVIVTGTAQGTDRSRLTAITLMTGDNDFLRRLIQGRPNRDGQNMSPGLPSDVVGGGGTNTTRDQP